MRTFNHGAVGLLIAAAPLALAACEMKPAETATTTSNTSTISRVETAATPTPAPLPTVASTTIQSQPGPKGAVAKLNKMQVTGDILTVQLTITGEGGSDSVPLDQISLIDDATSQRIGLLKDNAGGWMASPLTGKDLLHINLYESPLIVWMKFPAPPATSKTVSLNIPTYAPFDGVPVTR